MNEYANSLVAANLLAAIKKAQSVPHDITRVGALLVKGDTPGHEFHGNQYAGGGGSGGAASDRGKATVLAGPKGTSLIVRNNGKQEHVSTNMADHLVQSGEAKYSGSARLNEMHTFAGGGSERGMQAAAERAAAEVSSHKAAYENQGFKETRTYHTSASGKASDQPVKGGTSVTELKHTDGRTAEIAYGNSMTPSGDHTVYSGIRAASGKKKSDDATDLAKIHNPRKIHNKSTGEWRVEDDDGKIYGKFDSETDADKQLAALYTAKEKE